MTSRFSFVTGYPRSRTAWLSELITVAGFSFAFHEADVQDDGEVKIGSGLERMKRRGERYVVDCSSGYLLAPSIIQGARILLVSRDKNDALRSFNEFSKGSSGVVIADHVTNVWDQMTAGMDQILSYPNVMVVPFSQLNDEITCKVACQFLCPGYVWDYTRFRELQKKNIQQIPFHKTKPQ